MLFYIDCGVFTGSEAMPVQLAVLAAACSATPDKFANTVPLVLVNSFL